MRLWSTVVTHAQKPGAGRTGPACGTVEASVTIGSCPLELGGVGVPVRLRDDLHGDAHRGVPEPAEPGALAPVRPGLVGPEPGRVGLAGDRVDLRAERRHPPVVV